MEGVFGIYKPIGPTSFKIISELRKITGIRRIGHAGTLDPLAKGVLVVAIGSKYTKEIDKIVATEKEYIAEIKLGETSTTDDGEGEKTTVSSSNIPTIQQIEHILPNFIGEIDQVPPAYSAIKIAGKRAYDLARGGKNPEMKSRKVEIKGIDVLGYAYPLLVIKVLTGKGVYIRSLARDIGAKLGTGAYMSGLERTRIGEFTKENSLTLDQFAEKFKK